MSKLEKIIFGIIFLVLIAGLGWVGWQTWQTSGASVTPAAAVSMPSPGGYAAAKAAEDPNNPCQPPPGYTEADWRTHMSHHPDQYRQCLGQ